MPFAVVGSREEMVVGGNKVRVRQYPWGTVESELAAFWGGGGGGGGGGGCLLSHGSHMIVM